MMSDYLGLCTCMYTCICKDVSGLAFIHPLLSSLFTRPMQVDCEQVQRMATHIAFFIPHLLYFTIIVVVIVHSIGRESKKY